MVKQPVPRDPSKGDIQMQCQAVTAGRQSPADQIEHRIAVVSGDHHSSLPRG